MIFCPIIFHVPVIVHGELDQSEAFAERLKKKDIMPLSRNPEMPFRSNAPVDTPRLINFDIGGGNLEQIIPASGIICYQKHLHEGCRKKFLFQMKFYERHK